MMNKIRKLLKSIFKKDRKDQDLEQGPEFDDIENLDLSHEEDATREIGADFAEEEIDLTDTKFNLKDKIDMSLTRFADKFRSLRQKEMKRESNSKKFLNFKKSSRQFSWENLPNELLSRTHHQKTHNYFQVAFIACFIYFIANLGGHLLNGKPNYKANKRGSAIVINEEKLITINKINQIKSSNIFRTTQVEKVEGVIKKEEDKKCDEADRKSRLPIKLVNTVVLQDSVKSVASVSIRSNSKLQSFRTGEKISTLAKIGKIDRLRLIIKNLDTGDCEVIESKNSKVKKTKLAVLTPKASKTYKKKLKKVKGIDTDGTNFSIKKEYLQEKLKDINSLITQAKGIKINNPDGSLSFKIVEIEPGSVYDSLGIQNNDIIKQIDGESIQTLNRVMSTVGNAANLKNMSLTIIRNGEVINRAYKIE